MALRVGTRLGPYEILALIGAGGMGDVYKADDTRLERAVAIKVLPADLAGDPERRQRFEREANAISKLNHPHICILHDVGREGGVDYLVLEYIEGETLADRLERGALPLEQALEYGTQMADGLHRAHRAGIVHRDLKPGNVMLTASGVKILDFGLAKPLEEPVVTEASAAPTRQKPLTGEDAIVGTLQYMAPEQLESKAVDERSDIFAFGAVLYEMITGKKAFVGESPASLIAAILEHQPAAISRLQPMSPLALDRIVRKCLEKDPDKRWQSATDLRDALQWIADGGEQSGLTPSTSKRSWRWTVLASLVTASVAALTVWSLTPAPPSANAVTRFSVPLQGYVPVDDSNLALSPDGRTLVYVAFHNGVSQLYSRSLDRLQPEAIAGSEGASLPFFSPDGKWIGFNDGASIKRVPLSGGTPTTLHSGFFSAASWVSDDVILFESGSDGTSIRMIAATGGDEQDVTTLLSEEGETDHDSPEMLPGGRAFLYMVEFGRGMNRIVAQSLETEERRDLLEGTWPRYAPTGHIVFARDTGLWAVPFDADQLRINGTAVPVVEGVPGLRSTGQFALARNGTLVYVPGAGRPERHLIWVDRQGHEDPLPMEPALYNRPKLSPDGRRIAVELESDDEIWVYDVLSGSPTRLTFDPGLDLYPLWSRDGQRVVFSSGRGGVRNLFWRAADGTGQVERLTTSLNLQSPWAWSRDGETLVFQERDPETNWGIRALTMEGERQSKLLVERATSGSVSTDGKWIAYEAWQGSPDVDVYVRPFPDVNDGRWQISTGGGFEPRWTRDGRELIYRTESSLMSVPVESTSAFRHGAAEAIFPWRYFIDGGGRSYDISPDGERFLVIQEVEADDASTDLVVVLNWFAELKRLAPADK